MNDKLQEKKKGIETFVTCFKPDWPTTSFYGEDGYEPDDEKAPFFTEAFLYNLIGKEDARVALSLVEGLLEEAERLQTEVEKKDEIETVRALLFEANKELGVENISLKKRVNQVESWLEEKCFEIAELKEKLGELTGKKYQALILCGPCGKVVQDGDPGHEKSGYSYCDNCAPKEEE